MKHVNRLLELLEGVKTSGNGWMARCPCNDHGGSGKGDNKPSLSINLNEENKILFHCFGGCTSDAVLEALGLDFQDLWPKEGDLEDDAHAGTGKTEGTTAEASNPDPAICHQVYAALQSSLTLSDAHRQHLRSRGLIDEQIDFRGYRSLTFFDFKQKIRLLREPFGDQLLQVPGFISRMGKVTAAVMPNGILIPIRDVKGNIIAFQIRSDSGDGPKYLWFSGGNNSSGSPTHVPLGIKPASLLRVTEGPLKADVVCSLDDVPTIGIAGVTSWPSSLEVLEGMHPETIRLAFDADAQEKKGVATALADYREVLNGRYLVEIEAWPVEKAKGLDDLLFIGGKPDVLSGAAAADYVERLLKGDKDAEVITDIKSEESSSDTTAARQKIESVEVSPTPNGSLKGPDRFPYGDGDPVPFPLDFFPAPLQEVIREISAAVNCPPDFPGTAMVVASAAAIGRSRQIEPKQDWKISPRFYMGLVGEPGSGKTPAVTKIMRPLWKKNNEWNKEYKGDKEVYDAAMLAYEAEKKEFIRRVSKKTQEAKERRCGGKTEGEAGFEYDDA